VPPSGCPRNRLSPGRLLRLGRRLLPCGQGVHVVYRSTCIMYPLRVGARSATCRLQTGGRVREAAMPVAQPRSSAT
jgi:hypothetical protein